MGEEVLERLGRQPKGGEGGELGLDGLVQHGATDPLQTIHHYPR